MINTELTEENLKMSLTFKSVSKTPKLKNPILISGLPGIGNIGKLTIDFLIKELKAKQLYEIHSYEFPHSVFINEKNLVELPIITIHYYKNKKYDLLLLTGDVQPINESSCYEFCHELTNLAKKLKVKEIITLGGMGLPKLPEHPKIYCTANEKSIIKKFQKNNKIDNKLYGIVGPIIGVSGLLLGIAKQHKIPAICLLAETLNHPAYLGIKGSREIIKILNKQFTLNLNIKKLNKEIDEIEEDILKAHLTKELSKNIPQNPEVSYIG